MKIYLYKKLLSRNRVYWIQLRTMIAFRRQVQLKRKINTLVHYIPGHDNLVRVSFYHNSFSHFIAMERGCCGAELPSLIRDVTIQRGTNLPGGLVPSNYTDRRRSQSAEDLSSWHNQGSRVCWKILKYPFKNIVHNISIEISTSDAYIANWK